MIAFLDVRIRETKGQARDKKGRPRKQRFINLKSLQMPYGTLEKKYKISRSNIPKGFDELLEKGFLKIVHHGGSWKHDKSIYALSDNYLLWKKGIIFEKRLRDAVHRGYQGKHKKQVKNLCLKLRKNAGLKKSGLIKIIASKIEPLHTSKIEPLNLF